tara:strand:- start:481 stop:597 length:117 start_codon:yes stop_codon:yes gene_type:complete
MVDLVVVEQCTRLELLIVKGVKGAPLDEHLYHVEPREV